jgi:hypothetical protein
VSLLGIEMQPSSLPVHETAHIRQKTLKGIFAFCFYMKFKKTQSFSKSFRPTFSVSLFLVLLAGEHGRFNNAKQVYIYRELIVTELFHA